ncbi:uncharacterized protein [Nicotiana sylvestris]|uniref:uncharacterized protein n=1 Tax=Nicotiana sylvestris TaxID=4096 RepID=UPI00388C8593
MAELKARWATKTEERRQYLNQLKRDHEKIVANLKRKVVALEGKAVRQARDFETESGYCYNLAKITCLQGDTDHVSRDREAFIEFRRVPPRSKHVYVGNNAKLEVKGIGTFRMDMRGGRSLMLHDVLYVPEIRRNLVSVSVLLDLDFNLNFSRSGLRIT